MSSIDELKSLISSKGGVAMNNQFMVKLPEMPFSTSRDLNILCRNVILPGRQILTSDRIVGPKATKVAYGFAHDECSMTFQVLNDYGVKKYFVNLAIASTFFPPPPPVLSPLLVKLYRLVVCLDRVLELPLDLVNVTEVVVRPRQRRMW